MTEATQPEDGGHGLRSCPTPKSKTSLRFARKRLEHSMPPYYGYFPPSKPKEAKGGIKAQSKRGAFGESWWAKRWIEVLSGFNLGTRLTRGRSYARSGQVLAVEIGVGAISAKVQGSRSKPYSVTIRVKTLSPAEWSTVATVLSHETGHVAPQPPFLGLSCFSTVSSSKISSASASNAS